MDEKFQIILSNLPEKPPRSRLEPYRELIYELRQRGWTYREIAQILNERCHIPTSRSAVNDFVRVRARRKSSRQPSARPQKTARDLSAASSVDPASPATQTPDGEVRRRIEELKRRPLSSADLPGNSTTIQRKHFECRIQPRSPAPGMRRQILINSVAIPSLSSGFCD